LIAIELPISAKNSAYFFHEFARRHGDYAMAGLAAQAVIEGGILADLRLAYFAVGDRPVLAGTAKRLTAKTITPALLSEASRALGDELDPQDDQQATGVMRRHLAQVLLRRCVAALLSRPELVRATA
jgi:carbon-monoxide dehydrogenase medium subunit